VANPGATELEARIQQFEMAFRMQSAVPEATDISKEPESVLKLYGEKVNEPGSFERNCLLARRFAERDVRFIQLYHPGWDHHGNLPESMKINVGQIDRACSALIQDLKQHNLLDDTLVIFGSEFGRTCSTAGLDSEEHRCLWSRAPPRLLHLLDGWRRCETRHELWGNR